MWGKELIEWKNRNSYERQAENEKSRWAYESSDWLGLRGDVCAQMANIRYLSLVGSECGNESN